MGLYSKHIFPRLIELSLGRGPVRDQRRKTLAPLHGHVLEVGFGTGLNLSCYPSQVTRLTTIDSETMLRGRVADRIARIHTPVQQLKLDAGGLLCISEKFNVQSEKQNGYSTFSF